MATENIKQAVGSTQSPSKKTPIFSSEEFQTAVARLEAAYQEDAREIREELKRAEEELNRTKENVADLQAQLVLVEKNLTDVLETQKQKTTEQTDKLADVTERLTQKITESETLQQKLERQEATLADKAGDIAKLKGEISKLEEHLRQLTAKMLSLEIAASPECSEKTKLLQDNAHLREEIGRLTQKATEDHRVHQAHIEKEKELQKTVLITQENLNIQTIDALPSLTDECKYMLKELIIEATRLADMQQRQSKNETITRLIMSIVTRFEVNIMPYLTNFQRFLGSHIPHKKSTAPRGTAFFSRKKPTLEYADRVSECWKLFQEKAKAAISEKVIQALKIENNLLSETSKDSIAALEIRIKNAVEESAVQTLTWEMPAQAKEELAIVIASTKVKLADAASAPPPIAGVEERHEVDAAAGVGSVKPLLESPPVSVHPVSPPALPQDVLAAALKEGLVARSPSTLSTHERALAENMTPTRT